MERYEFTATTAKSDIIIGILFPMFFQARFRGSIMIPLKKILKYTPEFI